MKKVWIDCRSWRDRESAHESLKKELGFPDYYGRNADALYDLLTEKDFGIVLYHAARAKENMGKEFDRIEKVMRDADALDRVWEGTPWGARNAAAEEDAREKCAALDRISDEAGREKALRGLFDRLGARPRAEHGFRCLDGRHIRAGDDMEIGWGVKMLDSAPILLGDRVKIGAETLFTTSDPAWDGGESATISVGSDVRIGARCLILPGAVIPDGAVIAPGTVVKPE